jgi:hypothetical protein
MNRTTKAASLGLGAFLASSALVAEARASHLDACGGIYLDLEASSSCEVVPTETCTQECELVAGEKVCAARLTTTCDSSCTASAEVTCRSSCEETCVPSCARHPMGPPDCMGLCMSDCQQSCDDRCDGAANPGECRASCAQCCANDCHAQCDKEPEPVCDSLCTTACSGSCEARANIDCQVSCQSDLYTTCKREVVEECRNECRTTGAAIFCDGQFLATSGNLQACADQLASEFGVHLDVDIEASGSCDSDSCQGAIDAEANGGLGCSVPTKPGGTTGGLFGGLMALVGWAILRLRRTRRSR